MNAETLNLIREAEKASHIEIYSAAKLFEKGTWLQKPVKTVMDLLPLFSKYKVLNVLDLGCGVGRNCIPIAEQFTSISCQIDCVDILEFAIEMLRKYSIEFGVSDMINGTVSSIEDYQIKHDTYDLIFAVSALEHVASADLLEKKLLEIADGLKSNGIACLIINSEVAEINKDSGAELIPQFEVNLNTNDLTEILERVFFDYKVLKNTIVEQHYDIPRIECVSSLSTNVVTYVVQKIK